MRVVLNDKEVSVGSFLRTRGGQAIDRQSSDTHLSLTPRRNRMRKKTRTMTTTSLCRMKHGLVGRQMRDGHGPIPKDAWVRTVGPPQKIEKLFGRRHMT